MEIKRHHSFSGQSFGNFRNSLKYMGISIYLEEISKLPKKLPRELLQIFEHHLLDLLFVFLRIVQVQGLCLSLNHGALKPLGVNGKYVALIFLASLR